MTTKKKPPSKAESRRIVERYASDMAASVAKTNVGQWFPLTTWVEDYKEFRATYVKGGWIWEVR